MMYSRPSAFGPPVSGRGPNIGAGAYYNRAIIADSLLGANPSFTPPYYDGEAWCDIIFRPSSSVVTIDDIFEISNKYYWRFDKLGLGNVSNNTHAYGNLNINHFAMQLSSSFNLFQKIRTPGVEFDKDGNPINITDKVSDENSVWVMQPKFETPMYNFSDTGVHPIRSSTGTLTVPTNNSESVTRGMWHQFGVIPKDPQKGVFLEVTDIPYSFLNKRVPKYISSSYSNHTIDVNAGSGDDTEIKAVYNNGNVKSLLDNIRFPQKVAKLGQTANKKVFSEAIVAVPFIEAGGERQFFKIDRAHIDEVLRDETTDLAGDSIKSMVAGMKKFVLPPTMDYVTFGERVDPIAMYFFEFEFEFDQNDLTHIWQNLTPPSSRIVNMSEVSVSHELLLNEILGRVSKETGRSLPDRLKWMVFKVKQRAQKNYFSKVAGSDADADSRFRFGFTAGRAGREERELELSYNWPYDFFSMIELIKMESEIKFAPTDKDIDSKLVIDTTPDEAKKGIKATDVESPAVLTPRLPKRK